MLAPAARGATLVVAPGELSAKGGTTVVLGLLTVPRKVGVELATWEGKRVAWLSAPKVRRAVRLAWHGRLRGTRVPDGYYHVRLVYRGHVLAIAPVRVDSTPPRLSRFRVTNDGTPFAGDRRLLTTISPNGDGFRDHARIEFRLSETARVDVQFGATSSPLRPVRPVAMLSRWLPGGEHSIVWAPSQLVSPRTYVTRLTAVDRAGNRRTYGAPVRGQVPGTVTEDAQQVVQDTRCGDASARTPRCRPPFRLNRAAVTPVISVQGVDAGFTRDSYLPGELARLVISTDAPSLTLQLFRSGPEVSRPRSNDILEGRPVSEPRQFSWMGRRSAPSGLRLEIPELKTGFYFARLLAPDGRVGYAPFVVRPPQLGRTRVAVVLPTFTWQAYNFRDEDGDGWGDTWYAGKANATVRLGRPYLNRGVPPHFRAYDLGFLHWLSWWRHDVDYLSDSDLRLISSGGELARLYDLVIFPGHEEYVTKHMYDIVEGYRDLGGNLMFLSADNFYWRVDRYGTLIRRTQPWRLLGRPEARLIGVQYRGNDSGEDKKAFVVVNFGAAPWLFAGTGLVDGSTFGLFGIEIDAKAPSSPPATQVLATLPEIFGPGFSAEMTYYETSGGAKVFAAGALGFAGSAPIRPERILLENLWDRLHLP